MSRPEEGKKETYSKRSFQITTGCQSELTVPEQPQLLKPCNSKKQRKPTKQTLYVLFECQYRTFISLYGI